MMAIHSAREGSGGGSDRAVDEAIRVTEERLRALKAVVERRRRMAAEEAAAGGADPRGVASDR